jgi:hypothetical protein
MSRRPSLPGAAELFRATGSGHAPAEPAAGREVERPVQRLRPADVDASPIERTASVTPLGSAAPSRSLDDGQSPGSPAPAAPWPVEQAAMMAPATPKAAAQGGPAAAPSRAAGTGMTGAFEDDPARVQRTNGVRQTRRQRVRNVGERRPSGRERHDEKITVYCSAEELFDLENARLSLRGQHGLVVDRGRIVREAVAIILADLDAKGDDSILVRRLREI